MSSPYLKYLSEFAPYLEQERGASPHTVSAYMSDIHHYLEFNKDNPISSKTLTQYYQYLSHREYHRRSIIRKRASIQHFIDYLNRTYSLSIPRQAKLKKSNVATPLPKHESLENILKLINAPNPEHPFYYRNTAILEIMYGCGLRISELVQIQLCHLYSDCLKIWGKRRKERLVPLSPHAINRIAAYRSSERPHYGTAESAPYLFLGRTGTAMTRTRVYQIIKGYAHSIGLPHLTPHQLRHSFATHLLNGGANLREVQELLGHSHITSTEIYTHIAQHERHKEYKKYHPRA